MTDEEKALQLAGLKETPDEEERYYNPFNCKIYDKCLEMAQWKEQQMIEWFEDNIDLYHFTNRDFNEPQVNWKKLLEDFKSNGEINYDCNNLYTS